MPVVLGFFILLVLFFALTRIAIINAERRDAEKKRGDTLQEGIDALRNRSEEDRKFFEIVRQLMISQGADQRKALTDQLRDFKFTTTTVSTTNATRGTSATTTTTISKVTPATSSTTTTATTRPPSTTSTTRAPPSSTSTTRCINTPVTNLCTQQ